MTDGDGVVLGVAVATALVFGSTVALGVEALRVGTAEGERAYAPAQSR